MKRSALKNLSDKELLAQIQRLRRREHLSTIEILLHLNEVERRKLDLKLGYNSLYDYCMKHLRYSSSGAGRRVAVARCVKQHPEVLEMLRSQKLNVTGVALVASVLNDSNKGELLESIQGKSQGEIDAVASCYRRPIALMDRVKPVRVRVPEARAPARGGHDKVQPAASGGACEKNHYSHNGSIPALTGSETTGNGSGNRSNVRTKQALLIQFLADKAFMKKYEEVRALLSQRLSDASFENVFEELINEFLERHSPVRRKTRRDQKRITPKESRPPAVANGVKPQPNSRHIPAAVRDKVYTRDKGRCTYVGSNGKRCGSTQALQVDHIKPFARGGSNAVSNLRLLCAKHNRLAAREVFGEDFMKHARARE